MWNQAVIHIAYIWNLVFTLCFVGGSNQQFTIAHVQDLFNRKYSKYFKEVQRFLKQLECVATHMHVPYICLFSKLVISSYSFIVPTVTVSLTYSVLIIVFFLFLYLQYSYYHIIYNSYIYLVKWLCYRTQRTFLWIVVLVLVVVVRINKKSKGIIMIIVTTK